jgi:integral membrane protein
MAFVVGVWLLVFCAMLLAKYVFHTVDSDSFVAIVHGWLFMVYALLSLDLAFRMRWGLGRMFLMVIAGMVPFLSFVMEHKVVGWVRTQVAQTDVAQPTS